MYIWILLATIMVALSFFNTSPREDKASVFTEIKASTFINRFRAEHTGYFRTLECDILYNSNRYEDSIIPIQKSDVENLGYTSLASNLPIGYNEKDNGQVIYHGIYCFDKDLREERAALTNCNTAAQRYLFSFSGISERWTSKAKYSITLPDTVTASSSGKVVEISAPVPAFSNYLAKELHGIKNAILSGVLLSKHYMTKMPLKINTNKKKMELMVSKMKAVQTPSKTPIVTNI